MLPKLAGSDVLKVLTSSTGLEAYAATSFGQNREPSWIPFPRHARTKFVQVNYLC